MQEAATGTRVTQCQMVHQKSLMRMHLFPYVISLSPPLTLLDDVDRLSQELGIPWETSKDIHFASEMPFISFLIDSCLHPSMQEIKVPGHDCALGVAPNPHT